MVKAILARIAAIALLMAGLISYSIANDPIPPQCPPETRVC